MPSLLRRFNYKNIVFDEDASRQSIGVLKRDGSIQYVRWLGFISLEGAKTIPHSKAVKLEVFAVSEQNTLDYNWDNLGDGEYIQGCLTTSGVFGVLLEGKPRIVSQAVM